MLSWDIFAMLLVMSLKHFSSYSLRSLQAVRMTELDLFFSSHEADENVQKLNQN